MKPFLSGFTVIEILVALTMLSFLTVTGLGISQQVISQYRVAQFTGKLQDFLDELEAEALSSRSWDHQQHVALYGRISSGDLELHRMQLSHAADETWTVDEIRDLPFDHFPLSVSAEAVSFLFLWEDSVQQWRIYPDVQMNGPLVFDEAFSDFSFSVTVTEEVIYEYVIDDGGNLKKIGMRIS